MALNVCHTQVHPEGFALILPVTDQVLKAAAVDQDTGKHFEVGWTGLDFTHWELDCKKVGITYTTMKPDG